MLKEIILDNYRNHDRLEVKLNPGVIGITGPNGSGKSSFISGICWGLLGHVLGDETKKDLIRWGEKKGYAKVKFSFAGMDYEIKRTLHGNTQVLECVEDKDKTLRGKEEIDSFISGLIKLDPSIADKLLFISPYNLDEIFRLTRSKRVDYFNLLFGGKRAEKLRSLIMSWQSKIQLFSDRSDEVEEISHKLDETVKSLLLKEGQLRKVNKQLTQYNPSEIETLLRRPLAEEKEELLRKYELHIKRLRDNSAAQKKAKRPVKNIEIKPEEITLYDKKKEYLAYLEERKSRQKAIEEVDLPDPATFGFKPKSKTTDDLLREVEAFKPTINDEWIVITENVKACKTGKCRVCGAKIPESKRKPEKWREKEKELREKGRLMTYYIRQLVVRKRLEDDFKSSEQEFPEEVKNFDVEAYLERCRQSAAAAKLHKYNSERDAQIAANEREIQRIEVYLEEQRKIKTITKQQKKEAEEAWDELQHLSQEKAQLDAEIKSLQELKQTYEKMLSRLEKDKEKADNNIRVKKTLAGACGLLHRDALPARVTSIGIQALNARIRYYLELFSIPWFYIDDNMDIVVDTTAGAKAAKSALSCGQLKIAAIIFKLAQMELFSSIPFIVFDEPTAYLDEDNLNQVIDVFSKLNVYAKKRNMTVMVATNDPRLDRIFNYQISM